MSTCVVTAGRITNRGLLAESRKEGKKELRIGTHYRSVLPWLSLPCLVLSPLFCRLAVLLRDLLAVTLPRSSSLCAFNPKNRPYFLHYALQLHTSLCLFNRINLFSPFISFLFFLFWCNNISLSTLNFIISYIIYLICSIENDCSALFPSHDIHHINKLIPLKTFLRLGRLIITYGGSMSWFTEVVRLSLELIRTSTGRDLPIYQHCSTSLVSYLTSLQTSCHNSLPLLFSFTNLLSQSCSLLIYLIHHTFYIMDKTFQWDGLLTSSSMHQDPDLNKNVPRNVP